MSQVLSHKLLYLSHWVLLPPYLFLRSAYSMVEIAQLACLFKCVLCSSLQLLSDASDGCLEVHHGDVLEFDIKKLCDPHVDRKAWEEGKKRLVGKFQKKKNYMHQKY